jgi:hypothetical protein
MLNNLLHGMLVRIAPGQASLMVLEDEVGA